MKVDRMNAQNQTLPNRSTNADRSRKLLIRTALVTTSTIATLVGAQNLAMLDARQNEPIFALEPTQPLIQTIAVTAVPTAMTPTVEIIHAAPKVTILRSAGQAGPIQPPSALQQVAIQPPAPIQLAAPQPVIVQGEAPPPIIIQQSSGSSSGGGGQSSRSNSSR
jgi:hypothetical protein